MLRLIYLVLLLFSFQETDAVDVPPLAFESSGYDGYVLVDVETMLKQIIRRDGTLGGNETAGFNVPPKEVNLRAPANVYGQLILVDESDPNTDGTVEGGYTLYFEFADSKRLRIVGGLSFFLRASQWSPDGRYVYLQPFYDAVNPKVLYRFDVQTQMLEPIVENVVDFYNSCQRYTVHCIIRQREHVTDDSIAIGSLSHLNKQTGELSLIAENIVLPQYITEWQREASVATLFAETNNGTTIYGFNAETKELRELIQFPNNIIIRHASISPENNWLLVRQRADQLKYDDYFVYNMNSLQNEPIHLTADFIALGSSSQHSPQWLDKDTVGIDGRISEDESGFYTIDVPDGTRKRVNVGHGSFYDEAWSSNGSWFAYIDFNNDLYAIAVEPDAEPIKIAENVSCVAWESLEIGQSGQVYLCDKHWGVG